MRLSLVLIAMICLAVPASAQQVGEFTFATDFRAALSSSVDPFWDDYQNTTDQPPWGVLSAGLENRRHWKIHAEGVLKQQFGGWQNNNVTLPEHGRRIVPVDYHVFRAGYLWYNFEPLEVTFGRNKLHYGPEGHSLVISDSIPFLDMLRFRLPMNDWLLDSTISTPETRNGFEENVSKTTLLVLHRLQWSSGGLTLGFVEEALLDRPSYALTDFLPVILSHQADMKPFNTSMSLDADWQASPEWRFWGQLASDESNGQEFGVPDTDNPDILAFIIGVEYRAGPIQTRWEIGRTDYLWGNFDDDKPGAKAIYRMLIDNGVQTLYLSSPYGPGAQWVNGEATWSERDWSITLNGEFWTTLDGVTLEHPYPGTRPDESKFTVNGRYRAEASLTVFGSTFWAGPQLLVRGGSFTPQLLLGVKTSWGVKP